MGTVSRKTRTVDRDSGGEHDAADTHPRNKASKRGVAAGTLKIFVNLVSISMEYMGETFSLWCWC